MFQTMEQLLDEDNPMDIERAEAVGKVAQVVVNSAKVEVDFLKQTGHGGTAFLTDSTVGPRRIESGAEAVVDINARDQDLCQRCTLPECDETSPQCLIRIKRKAA